MGIGLTVDRLVGGGLTVDLLVGSGLDVVLLIGKGLAVVLLGGDDGPAGLGTAGTGLKDCEGVLEGTFGLFGNFVPKLLFTCPLSDGAEVP